MAEHGPEGWLCSLCPAEGHSRFLSIEALWQDHLFEPFRRWINTMLIVSKGVAFYGDGGMTWVKLIANEKVDDQSTLMVRFIPPITPPP